MRTRDRFTDQVRTTERVVEAYVFDVWCFVRHPAEPSLWLRCPVAVALVDCSYCGAQRGDPCRGASGSVTRSIHTSRRIASRRMRKKRSR